MTGGRPVLYINQTADVLKSLAIASIQNEEVHVMLYTKILQSVGYLFILFYCYCICIMTLLRLKSVLNSPCII